MSYGNRPLESSIGALHQAIEPPLMLSFGAFHATHDKGIRSNRYIKIFSSHSWNLDTDEQRLSCFPRFGRKQRPVGKVLTRRSPAGGFLRSVKIGKGSRTAAEEFSPTFRQGLPCTADPALQPVTPFLEVSHRVSLQL